MQTATPRFETTLPRAHFFSPKPPVAPLPVKPASPTDWRALGIVGILAITFIAAVEIIAPVIAPKQQPATIPGAVPVDEVKLVPIPESQRAPDPVLPLPEVRRATIAPVASAPRAQLLRIRALGTIENDRMPDGRLLTTLYKGELPTVGDLPRTGGQLGDMWFTRRDGHCWVLAPVTAGSQSIGWVDP